MTTPILPYRQGLRAGLAAGATGTVAAYEALPIGNEGDYTAGYRVGYWNALRRRGLVDRTPAPVRLLDRLLARKSGGAG